MLLPLAMVHVMAQFIKFQIFYEPKLDSCFIYSRVMFDDVARWEEKVGQKEPKLAPTFILYSTSASESFPFKFFSRPPHFNFISWKVFCCSFSHLLSCTGSTIIWCSAGENLKDENWKHFPSFSFFHPLDSTKWKEARRKVLLWREWNEKMLQNY